MSPIDTAVFQYTALGLLGLTLVVALVALLRIGGLKRALRERPSTTADDVVPFGAPEARTAEETPEQGEQVAATDGAAEPAAEVESRAAAEEGPAEDEEARPAEGAPEASQEPVGGPGEAVAREDTGPTEQEAEPAEAEPELVREGEVPTGEPAPGALTTPSEASGDGLAESPAAQAPESGEGEAVWGAEPEAGRKQETAAEPPAEEEPEPRLVGAAQSPEGAGAAESREESLSTPSTVTAQQQAAESAEGAYAAERTWDEVGDTTPVGPEEGPAPAYAWARDMPEEQPIERDGRWWFKRGGELLLYDETTAQWVPAPVSEGPAGSYGDSPGGTAEFGGAAAPEATSSFWKCPSCGAVNGSTASTCRMCFAARP